MKIKYNVPRLLLFSFLLLIPADPLPAWDLFDRVIAIVNTKPIVESEVIIKLNQLRKLKRLQNKNIIYDKSRVLDKFIENVLVNETADNESILISQTKLLLELENMMRQYFRNKFENTKDLDSFLTKLSPKLKNKLNGENITAKKSELDEKLNEFIKYIELIEQIDFNTIVNELTIQMKRDLIINLTIGVSPPTKQEITDWYNKNQKVLGLEVRVKHILIRPKDATIAEERNANTNILELLRRIRSGESFDTLARQFSEDRSSSINGGDIGWVHIGTLDPYFANYVFQMNRIGEISEVFKSNFGYHIVLYLGKRDITLDKVERLISMKLHSEKIMEQFNKWVLQRKKESSIKIYMENYIKSEGENF